MKIVGNILVLMFLSTNAYSFVGERLLQQDAKSFKKQALKAVKINPQSCTDFSGTWSGVCTGLEENPSTDTMKIEQYDCEELFLNDSTNYLIGGTNDKNEANASYSYQNRIMMGWNADATKIEYVVSGSGTTLGQGQYSILAGSGTFSLVNDELIVATKVQSTNYVGGTKNTKAGTISCKYTNSP